MDLGWVFFFLILQEFAPTDDEINALKAGKEWNLEMAKELEKQRVRLLKMIVVLFSP